MLVAYYLGLINLRHLVSGPSPQQAHRYTVIIRNNRESSAKGAYEIVILTILDFETMNVYFPMLSANVCAF